MKGHFLTVTVTCLLAAGCSTTRVLAPGQYRLARNEVVVDDRHFSASELTPYIRQQANTYFLFGWNPFLNIYNWSDGSDKPMSRFWRKIGVAPVVFNQSQVETSIDNICNHLKHLGYYNATVTATQKSSGKLMKVTYDVRLGKLVPISDVRFEIPAGGCFEKEFYADTASVMVRKGVFLSEQILEAETARSSEYFRDRGFYNLSQGNYVFFADTLTCPGTAILDYRIREYARGAAPESALPLEQYNFGKVSIHIDSTLRFKEKLLRRLNAITPGNLYNETDVNKTYSRFSSLQVFSGVNISTSPSDSNRVNCDVTLSPSKLKGFKVNLEGSITSTGLISVSPQINFYHKNLFHGGEWFNLGFSGAFQFQPSKKLNAEEYSVSASISLPRPILIPQSAYKSSTITRTEIKASYNFQHRPEFTRHVVSSSMGYNGRIKNRFFFQLYPVQLSYVQLKNITDEFLETLIRNPYLSYSYSDHFDAGAGGTLYWTSNSDIVPKVSYRYARFNFDASGNLISLFRNIMPKNVIDQKLLLGVPFSQYVRGELQLADIIRFGIHNGQAIAGRIVAGAGYAYGNSYSLPYEKQFFVGGASSMRGWQARSVGPGFSKPNSYTSLPSQTGDVKLEADLEYRAKLVWKLEAALFAEVGNVWSLYDEASLFRFKDFYQSLAADWGFGLRVNLDFLVLRVDMGLKVHDPSADADLRWRGPDKWFKRDGFAFHFGVGYPF